MFNRATWNGKALSLLIVWTLALGGLAVLLVSAAPPASAASTCSQVGGVINGNWVITTAQVCSGIVYTVDGSVYITAGGSLYLQNGGIVFSEDTAHPPSHLYVNASSSLTLDNAYITTETNQINPYLKLQVNVQGAGSQFNMWNGSYLQFPGWFTESGGARLTMHNSQFTAFTDAQLQGLGVSVDDNDDSPVTSLAGSTMYLYQSQIEHMYENAQAGFFAANLTLASSSVAYVYDSYLSVDFSNNPHLHNEMQVDATSKAYLFNTTVDTTESASLPQSEWEPAFNVTASGGSFSIFRWADVTVTDSAGQTVSNTKVTSRLSPSNTIGTYPDSGSATPSATTLAYLGKTASTWNVTDAFGHVLIPLYTDSITFASMPNGIAFGSYVESATYNPYSGATGVSFPPYPDLDASANLAYVTVVIDTAPICSGTPITWSTTATVTQPLSVSSSVIITGHITFSSASLFVEQSQTACAYVMVATGGSLTLVNSSISSNLPMVLAVAGTGTLTASQGSYLGLSVDSSYGLLRSNATATVTIQDSTIAANISLLGAGASLVRDTLMGPSLSVDTTALAKLYDLNLNAVTSISLLTDLGNPSSLALDIRNTTFNPTQTSQLHFSGTQDVQFTNVNVYDPYGTWYLGMIGGNAVVSRYWWMTLNDVDGTGTLLANANATILLQKINPTTLQVVPAPNPVPGDTIYFTPDTAWAVSAPLGMVLYRAYEDSWTANGGHSVDDTYVVGGTASVQGSTFYPDANVTTSVTTNGAVDLQFSTLTPDFSVVGLVVSGQNGIGNLQPLNRPMTLTATILNTGRISVRNVTVAFFSTNVDLNNDGVMDYPVSTFEAAGALINETTIAVISGDGQATTSTSWTFLGSSATPMVVSVVVNPPLADPYGPGAIPETNMRNNTLKQSVNLFAWPNLRIGGPTDVSFPSDAVANNDVNVTVTVHNIGTAAANGGTLVIKEGAVQVSNIVTYNIGPGQSLPVSVRWHPQTPGYHNITIYVLAPNGTDPRTLDYDFSDNWFYTQRIVLSQPDLALNPADYTPLVKPQNTPFAITVKVYNLGQTPVQDTSIAVFLNGNLSTVYGNASGIYVDHETNVTVQVSGLPTPAANQTLNIEVNPDHTLVEGGLGYANNWANVTISVTPPVGTVFLTSPGTGTTYGPSDQIPISGVVRDSTIAQNGIPNLPMNISIVDANNNVVYGPISTTTDTNGVFYLTLTLPGTLPDGTYTLRVSSSTGTGIAAATPTIIIHREVAFLFSPVPLLGIQWWLFLIILAAVAAIVIGVTVYFKVYGLGKMVECGECGAFIPEDATTCPKCGVEFEKDMAKCSNCQAWIPVDVKQCPECGVEFATGEVEMADYQEKMRLQYDEVVAKFKDDASRQLGRSLSDKEFQEWWRKQPTFLTFEDWLREEEEMRKMGSRPCPVCGTLNSVTATVCHKCGSLMKEDKRPPTGGPGQGGLAPPARPQPAAPAARAPPGPSAASAEAPGTAPAPGSPDAVRRVIRKPIAPAPVVQKKVIKRPVGEGEQASTQESTDQQQSQSGDQKQGDEL